MTEQEKNVDTSVISVVFEPQYNQWTALLRSEEHDYFCGGSGDTASAAVAAGWSCMDSMRSVRNK